MRTVDSFNDLCELEDLGFESSWPPFFVPHGELPFLVGYFYVDKCEDMVYNDFVVNLVENIARGR